MVNIYKLVPRKNKEPIQKPYALVFKKTGEYTLTCELQITEPAFKKRIHNILDANNYEANYHFINKEGELQAIVELTHSQQLRDKVQLTLATQKFYEPANTLSLVDFTSITIRFHYPASCDAFQEAFENALLPFIDKKYEDYLKLKARLTGRNI